MHSIYLIKAILFVYCVFLIESTATFLLKSPSRNKFIYPNPSNRYKRYHFVLTNGYCQPDNYRQPCYLINGQFPGPSIFVNQFDFLTVKVINRLSSPTSIHFHGILHNHTLDADGTPFVTQDLILPGETYVYRMQIEGQVGTYMYHGHFELDLVWLHGPFIIRDNPEYWKTLGAPYQFDSGHEHVFQLETVFHEPLEELVEDILHNGNDDPTIASLAINGFSYGQWPNVQAAEAPGYEVIRVEPGRTYRFRIINISAGSYFRFKIAHHNLTVIETDGIIINPVVTSYLEINSGERYSVLVTMNNTPENYWISCILMAGADTPGPANGKAILHYSGAPDPDHLRKHVFLKKMPGMEPTFIDFFKDLQPNRKYINTQAIPFPEQSTRTILIDMHYKIKNGPPRFLINDHQFIQPNTTYLTRVRNGEDISVGDPHVFKILENDVVDIIFQNRVDDNGDCDQHPIHLHGHQFWVLLSGANTVDMQTLPGQVEHTSKNNGHTKVYRDVFTLFPNQNPENSTSGAGCGWSVIRFLANNPGLWLVHCHVTSHMMLGKMFTLYEMNPANPRLINE